MGILLNYDLDDKHTAVKTAMYAKGYQNYFEFYTTIEGKRVKKTLYLPNTTLYHSTKSTVKGRDELRAVAKEKGANVDHLLVVSFDTSSSDWTGVYGTPW